MNASLVEQGVIDAGRDQEMSGSLSVPRDVHAG